MNRYREQNYDGNEQNSVEMNKCLDNYDDDDNEQNSVELNAYREQNDNVDGDDEQKSVQMNKYLDNDDDDDDDSEQNSGEMNTYREQNNDDNEQKSVEINKCLEHNDDDDDIELNSDEMNRYREQNDDNEQRHVEMDKCLDNDANDDDDDGNDDNDAVDGGWGFAVLLGTFIIMITVGVISKCFGILFISFLNELGTSSAMVATIYNSESFFSSGANLVSGPLAEVFGFRSVAMVGSMLISVGFLISAASTSAAFLIFSHSFITGLGSGMCFLVSFAIIPIYFRRLRGRANAIMISGISIGGILGPPIITHFQEIYGFRGTTVIVAGIMLNNCVAASLFHPIAWHRKKGRIKSKALRTPSERNVLYENVESNVTNVSGSHNHRISEALENKTTSVCEQEKMEEMQLLEVNKYSVSAKNISLRNQELKRSRKVRPNLFTLTKILFQRLVRNVGVLRSPTALIITLGWCFITGVTLNFTMMVPFAMESQGYTQEEASWGLSISNICTLVAGIVASSMADLPKFSLWRVYMIFNFIIVVSTVAFCFVDGLVWLNVVLGAWGTGVGVVSSLNALIMVTYMGLDKYMAILGVSGVLNGIWLMASGPLLGVIRDVSGSYTVTLCFLATTAIISIILYFFLPAARAYDAKKAEEEHERKDAEVPRRRSRMKELEDVG